MIKYLLIFFLLSCSPVREIQVTARTWILIDKKPVPRFPEERDFVWLVWQTHYGNTYWEKVTENEALSYEIGQIIINRDQR